MSKKRSIPGGIVYSTEPSFDFDKTSDEIITIPVNQQNLRIRLDAKQRAGKVVTLVQGFEGRAADLEELGKKLKSYCGTGGSVKDNEIIVQGDNREKILSWLVKQGYLKARKI